MGDPSRAIVQTVGWGIFVSDGSGSSTTALLPSVSQTIDWVRLPQRFPVRIQVVGPTPVPLRIGQTVSVAMTPEVEPLGGLTGLSLALEAVGYSPRHRKHSSCFLAAVVRFKKPEAGGCTGEHTICRPSFQLQRIPGGSEQPVSGRARSRSASRRSLVSTPCSRRWHRSWPPSVRSLNF